MFHFSYYEADINVVIKSWNHYSNVASVEVKALQSFGLGAIPNSCFVFFFFYEEKP